MTSGHGRIPALGGTNPDYYAETASIMGHDASSGPGRPGRHSRSHSYSHPHRPQQQQQQQYLSPPGGAAPYYQQQQYLSPPGGAAPYSQQPAYPSPTGSGSGQAYYPPPPPQSLPSPQLGIIEDYDHGDIPPPKPPRPVSSHASLGGSPGGLLPSPGGSPSPSPGTSPGTSPSDKPTFGERLHQWSVKAGAPINKMANKLGSEAFWPSSMDLECDKAARILQSFCKDGFYTSNTTQGSSSSNSSSSSKKPSQKALVKIPPRAIQTAAGLAIFTTFRTGLHVSGAGGSGVVVSRLPNGGWSPPSGFVVHTLGAGFMAGVDIYDCVCVLRTRDAVRAFSARPRLSLGGEIGLAAGPVGAGASFESALGGSAGDDTAKPVWSYMKSRGFYAGVQADGTVVVARPDANAAFYGRKGVTVDEILRGDVPAQGPPGMWPSGARQLMRALNAADGRRDADGSAAREPSRGPRPGDVRTRDGENELDPPPPYTRGRY